ncbi:hypothetical protein ACFTQ7_21725 [Lysinibacillus sp. NPDC056959]|uniref:hypothetical protein n=1 Tax=Lysinibacillus sp. NPDC056959 TaxID=3345981 RepID=UPI0036438EAE
MIRLFLELIRIIVIFLVLGSMMGALVKLIYANLGINVDNTNGGWLVGISIYILFFVLYRNKFQFSGFYKGPGKEKLPKEVSNSLILCSILMLFIAPFFN